MHCAGPASDTMHRFGDLHCAPPPQVQLPEVAEQPSAKFKLQALQDAPPVPQ